MYADKIYHLSPKELNLLLNIYKIRGINTRYLTMLSKSNFSPFVEFNKNNKEHSAFFNSNRVTQKYLNKLRSKGLIHVVSVTSHLSAGMVVYGVTPKGVEFINHHLDISVFDKYNRSGFDFDLGYFEEQMPPRLSEHSLFQAEVYALITWINNRHISKSAVEDEALREWNSERMLASKENRPFNKPQPKVSPLGIANICSWRDNLHSSERPNDVYFQGNPKEYKPDGELRFQSRYLHYDKARGHYRNNGELLTEHYFLEVDMVKERGNSLYEKMERLVYRLNTYDRIAKQEIAEGVVPRNKLYKGVILVLPDPNKVRTNRIDLKRLERFKSFYESFISYAPNKKGSFSIVLATPKTLENTLKSLRLEYYESDPELLRTRLKHPNMKDYFIERPEVPYGRIHTIGSSWHTTYCLVEEKVTYLFFAIEGFNSARWTQFLKVYLELKEHYKNIKNMTIYPIAYFRYEMPTPLYLYRDVIDRSNKLTDAERDFYTNLHFLNLQTVEPRFSYYGNVIDRLPHESD